MHDHENTVVHKHTASSNTLRKSVPITCLFPAQEAAATAAQWKVQEKSREM